jgi:orotate phosphoribosyltransferase
LNAAVTPEERSRAWGILQRTGALLEGHYRHPRTGLHYEQYFQTPLALQHTRHARALAVSLGRIVRRSGALYALRPGHTFTIVTPGEAGIPVAFWMGEHLDAHRILWANRKEGNWSFRPLMKVDERDQVLLVDDVILTGDTLASLSDSLREAGSEVMAAAVMVDHRTKGGSLRGLPVLALVETQGAVYDPKGCPLCGRGLKLEEIGPMGR